MTNPCADIAQDLPTADSDPSSPSTVREVSQFNGLCSSRYSSCRIASLVVIAATYLTSSFGILAIRDASAQDTKPRKEAKDPSGTRPVPKPQLTEIQVFRDKYPLISLRDRLGFEKDLPETERPEDTAKLPAEIGVRYPASYRALILQKLYTDQLEAVHSQEVDKFARRPGFGVSRMPVRPPSLVDYMQRVQWNTPKVVEFSKTERPAQKADQQQYLMINPKDDLEITHGWLPSMQTLERFQVVQSDAFAKLESFGWVKDLDHVSGFVPHAFRSRIELHHPVSHDQQPAAEKLKPGDVWSIHRLELVSLLKHAQPAVYVSDKMPNMADLSDLRMRPLEDFEIKALAELREGHQVSALATENRILMLGGLRATKECLQCHRGPAGRLLGAFSYELLQSVP